MGRDEPLSTPTAGSRASDDRASEGATTVQDSLSLSPIQQAATPHVLSLEPRWYACRTRARAEKQVDRLLFRRGLQSYLPLVEREQQWADRKKRVEFPLFPGYLFARFPMARFLEVVETAGLVGVVGGRARPTPVREEELEAVRRFVMGIETTGLIPEPVDWLEPGVPVQVMGGPFQGMRGTLLETRGRGRVAVRLTAIRMALSVELDRASLKGLR
jgi:transcription antitermination factor NusG